MMNILKNKKGVTLLELLAVVIILGIIAAIAIPTIGGFIQNQREKAAIAEWTNIKEAARLYALNEIYGNDEVTEFTLSQLIENDFLGEYDGVIAIYVLQRTSIDKIVDQTQIKFSIATGELSIIADCIEIDGIVVEGEMPLLIITRPIGGGRIPIR